MILSFLFQQPSVRLLPLYLYNNMEPRHVLLTPYTGSYAEHGADMRYPLPSYGPVVEPDTQLEQIREHLEMLEIVRQLECPYLHDIQKMKIVEMAEQYKKQSKYEPNLFKGLESEMESF